MHQNIVLCLIRVNDLNLGFVLVCSHQDFRYELIPWCDSRTPQDKGNAVKGVFPIVNQEDATSPVPDISTWPSDFNFFIGLKAIEDIAYSATWLAWVGIICLNSEVKCAIVLALDKGSGGRVWTDDKAVLKVKPEQYMLPGFHPKLLGWRWELECITVRVLRYLQLADESYSRPPALNE